jgi:NitT/TauT family transport system substrate-binding protein
VIRSNLVKLSLVLLLVAVAGAAGGCGGRTEGALPEVRLSEVVRSVFYAPQYVALKEGFFAAEGLDITELTTAWGADKGAADLLAGTADIALFGPEAGIYVAAQGAENHFIAFAQLTATDGSFFLSREPQPDFTWDDVRGKTIIGGRAGGVPQMIMEYVLRENGIDPHGDLDMVQNIQFNATAGAFQGGMGDFIQLFEPTASAFERTGTAHIVASFGIEGGQLPYTVYHATKEYAAANPEVLQKFTNAVYRGQLWVENHSAEEVTDVILEYFPDTEREEIVKSVERYKAQGSWAPNPVMSKESLDRLQTIMIEAGELAEPIPYETIVTTEFAEETLRRVK